jgi:hypothetical protein
MKSIKPFHFRALPHTRVLLCLLTAALSAQAATFSWTNTSGGNWNASANWSPNGVPGGTDTGMITAAGTYTLTVSDNESISNLTLGAESGQVTIEITGGSFTLNGSATDSAQTVLTLNGGTLEGDGTFAVGGPFNWSGGTMNGIVQCNGGSVTVPSANTHGGQIINTGVMGWTANPIYMYGGSLVSNTVAGTLNVTNAAWYNESGGGTIGNAGVMNFWSSSTVDVPLTNFDAINVDSGVLGVGNGGANIGTITVVSGATFNPNGGTFVCLTGSVIDGAGNLDVGGGTVDLGAALNLTGTWGISSGTANYTGTTTSSGINVNLTGGTFNLNATGALSAALVTLSGGTLAGSQLVLDSGAFNWSGGTMNGIVQCNGGSVTVSGANMYGGQIINTGVMGWTANPIYMYGGSLISNTVTGTLNVTNAVWNSEAGGGAMANAGTMNVWGGSSSTVPFNNSGAVDINSGTLTLTGAVTLTNDTLNFGITSTMSYGTLALSGGCSFNSTTLGAIANGYTPAVGDTLPLINYGSEAGLFAAFILPPNANWEFDYGPKVFSLIVANLNAPYLTFVPITFSGSDPTVSFLLLGPIGSNYTIQVSTNLAEKDWATVTNFVSSVSSFYLVDTNSANYDERIFRAIMQ